MLEALLGQPAPVRQRPVSAAAVNPAVAQQEGQELLAFARRSSAAASRARTSRAPPHALHRHPHAGQLASPMQPRQRHRIAPIGLDPLSRLFGSAPEPPQRRHGLEPRPGDTARIRRTRLVAEMQLAIAAASLLISRSTAAGDSTPRHKPHLAAAPAIAIATACFSCNIERDKASLYSPMVRPPCMRLARPARATLVLLLHEKGGPPVSARDITSRSSRQQHGRQ